MTRSSKGSPKAAVRYSGSLRVRLAYRDATNNYRAVITDCASGAREIVFISPPAILSIAVDAPEAYDNAARAALAFSRLSNDAEYGDSGIVVSRRHHT